MISSEHPFIPSEAERDPVRRFRGRLAAPVTIVTAGAGTGRAGLTVSSLYVIEGEPGQVHAIVGPLNDLWGSIRETGRFVVHVCRFDHLGLADIFAGLRPNPGGPFAGIDVADTEWGPVLADLGDRAFCRLLRLEEVAHSGVVIGEVERVEVSDLVDPLQHFRGRYRRLA